MNRRYDFVGHQYIPINDISPDSLGSITNLIFRTDDVKLKWLELSMEQIGYWRARLRSTYISWALMINGLHVAHEKYADPEWIESNTFRISSVRPSKGKAELQVIAEWEGRNVASAHMQQLPMICSYGLIDLYSCLEEMVFELFRLYWNENPDQLIKGPEFKELRMKYRNKERDPDAWEKGFKDRLDSWQRKKLYDGLGRIFRSYCSQLQLKTPDRYIHTDFDSWAKSIEGLSLVRNCLTHGAINAPKELEEFSSQPYRMGFSFKEGDEIAISLTDLMNVDCFCDSLLTGINLSLFEKASGYSTSMKHGE